MVKHDTPPKMGKCQGAARHMVNMWVEEGWAPLKAHHVAGVLALPVSFSSLIHMTLSNIEPLSINTPALPYSSLRPQPHPPVPAAASPGPTLLVKQRKESERKRKQRYRGKGCRDAKRKAE